MPMIDFYVIEQASSEQSLLFACKLIEKAYTDKQVIYIHTESIEAAEYMDDLLWSFRDDSFLPHTLVDTKHNDLPPILIGYEQAPETHQSVLVNLAKQVPEFYNQYQRIIEIVFSDPDVQQLARERYKHYRDQGHDIHTHKLKANDI
jgi:DNA polymerase-3 subunit chi